MKISKLSKVMLCAVLIAVCAFANVLAMADAGKRVEPLPQTLDIENLEDCELFASFEPADVYLNDDGAMVVHMTVYDNELFDLADISALCVGDTLVIDGEEAVVTAIEEKDNGFLWINGGYDEGGYTLATNDDGVYYAIDYDDMRHFRALGEVTLAVAPDFKLLDSSDLDNPEVEYTADEFLENMKASEAGFYPESTIVTVAGGAIANILVVYVP